ncbi:MAG: 50S ribosomal protein L1 [Patescibacteria group bacterium]|nr:50S ribosomal protein L1 [Patescibacteria group bacterium]
MARSKKYLAAAKKIDQNKAYPIAEAIKLAKETSLSKFDGSLEVHVRLGVNTAKSDQQVRSAVTLPHGTGKTKKIAAFVGPEKEKDAQEAGADIVGGQELIDEIKKTGKVNFEVALATPDMMPKLAIIAKILGPKGLMPSPKNDTITTNLKKTITDLKKGKVNFKSDDTGNVHQSIGKISFTDDQLAQNYKTLIDAIRKAKPATAKGTYLLNISIASTMGPGIRVEN